MAAITYTLNTSSAILPIIEQEVSRAADDAFAEDGASLYDAIVLTSKDGDVINNLVEDGVSLMMRKMADVATRNSNTVTLNVTDHQSGLESELNKAITRFLAMYACNGIFQQKRAALVPEYTRRTQEALDNVVEFIRTRNKPART